MSPVPPYKHLCGITHFEYSLNFEIPNILPKANTAPYHGNNFLKRRGGLNILSFIILNFSWIQIACPRLSIDWGYAFAKPLLSPYEVSQVKMLLQHISHIIALLN